MVLATSRRFVIGENSAIFCCLAAIHFLFPSYLPISIWKRTLLFFFLFGISKFVLAPNPRRAPSRKPIALGKPPARGSGKELICYNPATGAKLGTAKSYTQSEVEQAIQKSREAQKDWGQSSFEERRALLQDILDWVVEEQNQKQIIEWSMQDSGKTITEAVLGEIMTTCEKIRWIISNGEDGLKPESRPVALILAFVKKAWVEYHPLGVIGIIVPWNYPVHNVFSAVVAALFAGNGAVVKVSEFASNSAAPMENVFRKIIAARGYNPDLVQVITGEAETGAALVGGGVDKILFIGSPQVGKLVMKAASANLTPVILELGGKDPFIVFDDCDFNHMLDVAIRGAFINLGQNCISAERFFVQEGIYDKFVKEITARVKQLRQGASAQENITCDLGAITMPRQAKTVEALVNDAISKGAKLMTGGRQIIKESKLDEKSEYPCYYPPTILADVTKTMKIANEEAFGPVMTIIKFKTEKELLEMVNGTEYGLGSSLFTTDYKKAERVGRQVASGMLCVNDYGMVPLVQSLPFGGIKSSGFGHFNGFEGLRGFSRVQAVVTDRFPFRTEAPPFLQYPVASNAHLIVQEAIRMIYGKSWFTSVTALIKLVQLLITSPKKPKLDTSSSDESPVKTKTRSPQQPTESSSTSPTSPSKSKSRSKSSKKK